MTFLVFTVVLSFISFLASAFVILRIVIPILPPHPLSRRVAPSEFGLPNYNFRSLSAADKSHLWLASLDLLALCVFLWQAVSENSGGAIGLADARDVAASARLWFALTIRQSCLLVVSALTLVHIRLGRSVSFGRKHWMIWAPTLSLGLTSTTLAAVLAGAGVSSFFAGIIVYSATSAILSTAAFGGLVYTLVIIKRNLVTLNEPADSWPPVKEVTEKPPRPSFATEDIDALREGSSWLTSDAGSSRHESISSWSFSTHHTCQGSMRLSSPASHSSLQPKSSHWSTPPTLGADPSIPPVPPLPSVYRGNCSPTCVVNEDPDPFRRDVPSRPRLGSQSSWLTSPSVSQATMSAWSFPTTPITRGATEANAGLIPHALPSRPATPMTSVVDLNAALLAQLEPSRPATPALSSAQVLGGYGYTPDSEKGIVSLAVTGGEIDISYPRYVLWLLSIWVPFASSLPYLVSIASSGSASNEALLVMFVLSVTVSSPLLALNILVRSSIPIPNGLFGAHAEPHSAVMRAPSPTETSTTCMYECKKSDSVTVVEGSRSGDVWVSRGDAVDGRGRIGRMLGLIAPLPRLAVLPPDDEQQDGEITPPLPMQEDTTSKTSTSHSISSAEFGRICKESRTSSHISGEETLATEIMIAQRHYSAVATTVVIPASPERTEAQHGLLGVATGVDAIPIATHTSSSHLRSRSASSVIDRAVTTADISAPPCQALPPTPPNIRNAKQTVKQLLHRKSNSSDFSFGAPANDDIKQIDALIAGVLPHLVPGLNLSEEVKIRDWEDFFPPLTSTVMKKPTHIASAGSEFGVLHLDDFTPPQFHSTPAHGRGNDKRKIAGHKRNHLSLSSLGLGGDGACTWKNDLNCALATEAGQYASRATSNTNCPNTVGSDKAVPNIIAHSVTESQVQQHAPVTGVSLGCSVSTRNMGLQVEIPQGTNSARTSLSTLIPLSTASTVTLCDVESIFEPTAQSTPYDVQKSYPYSNKSRDAAITHTVSPRHSSIAYIKCGEKSSEPVTSTDRNAPLTTLVPPVVRPIVPKVSTLQLRSSTSENRPTIQSGGLRALSLLKDRDLRKEGNTSKLAGVRPLVLGNKKLKLKATHDENADPNSRSNTLKPLYLRRSESSKMRGVLRRDEILPTVIVRPPSTNTKMESPYQYR